MAVRLQTTDLLTDFAIDDVDVAIRAGRGGWPDLVQAKLIAIDFTPMCSPNFLARHTLATPADPQIGRASCRERVCQYVSNSVVAAPLQKTQLKKHSDTPNL